MLFSLPILGQALLWTVIAVVAAALVRTAVTRKFAITKSLLFTGVGVFFVNLLFVYEALPAHVGSMNGWWFLLLVVFAAIGIVQGFAMHAAEKAYDANRGYGRGYGRNSGDNTALPVIESDRSWKPFIRLAIVAVLVLLIYPCGQVLFHQWPLGNAKDWAAQANITVADKQAKLPPTDNKHIVLVDREVALFNAQAVLGTGNIGSKYKLEKDDFVKQSIAGHLYWVCPLEYKDGFTQFVDSLSGHQKFPGFVVVDAEDPKAAVELMTGLDLEYTPRAMFGRNVLRHVYAAGYTDGNLHDPTIELDDNKKPYVTITYTRPKFVVGGDQMETVLLIDMKTGEIKEYKPEQLPVWVDRVISQEMAEEYANNWGKFTHPEAGWMTGTFYGGTNQMVVGKTYLAYNEVDAPVFVIAMTSNDSSNHSSTGILIYETRTQKGTFYPGLSGINLDVSNTLKSIQENNRGTGNMEPAAEVLYTIDGVPTWVAIYTTPQKVGRSFAGVGMMDAHNPESSAVSFGENKAVALRKYQTYIAEGRPNGAAVNTAVKEQSITGKVEKANWVNGKLYLVLDNDTKHRFAASPDIAGGGDLVEVVVGETITLKYKDFGAREAEVTGVEYNPAQGQK